MADSSRPGRRIARLLWLMARPSLAATPFGHHNRYHKVNEAVLMKPMVHIKPLRTRTKCGKRRPFAPARLRGLQGSGERAGHRMRQRFPMLSDRHNAAPAIGSGDHDRPTGALVGHEHLDQVPVGLHARGRSAARQTSSPASWQDRHGCGRPGASAGQAALARLPATSGQARRPAPQVSGATATHGDSSFLSERYLAADVAPARPCFL